MQCILNQLKWLPVIVDEESIATGLLDIIENASNAVRKEMIRFLPDTVPTKFHYRIAKKLL